YLEAENLEAETPTLVAPEAPEFEGVEAAPLEDETVESEAAADEADADYASWTREQAGADSPFAAGDDVGLGPATYAPQETLDARQEATVESMYDETAYARTTPTSGFAQSAFPESGIAEPVAAEQPIHESIDALFGHPQSSDDDHAAGQTLA